MIFDERLTELRKAKGINQKECATELGMTDASKYNKWENGKNCPDFTTVCQLAKYFDVTTDYLLGASDSKKNENDNIHTRLGLSDKAIQILEELYTSEATFHDGIINTINLILENESYWQKNDNGSYMYKDPSSKLSLFVTITNYLKAHINKNRRYAITPNGEIKSNFDPVSNQTGLMFDGNDIAIETEMIEASILIEIQQKLIKLKENYKID